MTELGRSTVEALEAFSLGQLDSVETANAVIGGDLMDLMDTMELPPVKVRDRASTVPEHVRKTCMMTREARGRCLRSWASRCRICLAYIRRQVCRMT